MAGCGIRSGIDVNCDKLRKVGGVKKRLFVFNVDETTYTSDGSGYVNGLSFESYGGLYEFEGQKKSHSGGYAVQNQAGGNKFFQHDVILKLFSSTPADDAIIEDLLVANVGVILETNNGEFVIYGIDNGMSMTAGTQNTGTEAGSDTTDTLTFTGEEKKKPRRFLRTDYATTLAYLEARVL